MPFGILFTIISSFYRSENPDRIPSRNATQKFYYLDIRRDTGIICRRTTSPAVSSLSRNLPIPCKCFSSPNNASPPPPKAANPKRNNSQPSLSAITRQFSSSVEPTSLKLIHVPVLHRLLL